MPAEFHFLRPEWFWALPLVLLLTVSMARRQLAPGSWQRVVDPALAPYVLSRAPVSNLSYRWWLMLIGGAIAVVSLAGPSWNRAEQPVFRSEQAMVIALDLSRSMDAQDLTPTRLARARLKILDILERRRSGQTALVVYSSNAFTVTPLTADADTIAALVNSLSTDIMPSRGSYPVAAIEKGQQLLEQAGVGYGEVLLITDGSSSPEAERAATDLLDAGYTLSVLGVGTEDGAPIPRPGGGFVTDRSGNIAVPRLDARGLQSLAAAGGGFFTTLSADSSDIEFLLAGEVASRSQSDSSQTTDQWEEEGVWLLLLLVPLASVAFRRGLVLALLIFVFPVTEPVHAASWDDLWKTPDQQGQDLLREGDAAAAAELFEDPSWRAVAKYRTGDYAVSAKLFEGETDADGLYNLGNALARQGALEPAITAYNSALELQPDMEDAIYNRDLIEQLKEQQQDSQGDQQGDQQQSSDSGGQAQQSEGESESDQAGEPGTEGDPGNESQGDSNRDEQANQEDMEAMQRELERAAQEAQQATESEEQQLSQAEAEAMRRAQEQTQAMEQWLRRIPDDPGGLLRRKFRYQYQRLGRDQDGNNLWPDDEVQPW
ncbi:MAG: VWA domain-containing protein [Gammaproteobacteria bacterium]|nr:VWA domain-containing protein [Gammaproteobacteria bacterium]